MGNTATFLSDHQQEDVTKAIDLYPNPSSGIYFLDAKDIFPVGSTYGIEIVDMQGRTILSKQVVAQGQQITFDLSDQPAGLYVVALSGPSLRYAKIIMKK